MEVNINILFFHTVLVFILFLQVLSIYVPNEIELTSKPYTTGLKIKTLYKSYSQPYYHSNYSKVYVHNKNYTSSILDTLEAPKSYGTVHPVYISEDKKEKIQNILKDHNTNIVDKDTLNERVVYKRRVEKQKNIQVFNKCPKDLTGQFVYDLSCNQYLDCWNGRGGPRNCAPGTLFNPKTLECDYPEKVECLTGPSGSTLTLQKTAKYETLEQAKCPDSFSGLIPNYIDCAKFIECNNGIQISKDCPPGTLFDSNQNVCNHPEQSTCFSKKGGLEYGVKEQFGGSSDIRSPNYGYRGNTYTNQQQKGYYPAHGSYAYEQQQSSKICDPTNPYCKTGGYIVSGQNIYTYPDNKKYYTSGATTNNGVNNGNITICNPNTQGCTPFSSLTPCNNENCGQAIVSSYNEWSTAGPLSGTVYMQYIMCNPAIEDCSSSHFVQGTFVMGPQGSLCNPVEQNCQPSPYIPTTYMNLNKNGANKQTHLPGAYYIKYVVCNPQQENCSQFQKGIIEAAYGRPYSTGSSSTGSSSSNVASGCDPNIHNCDTGTVEAAYGRPSFSPGYSSSNVASGCDPNIHNCDTVSYQNPQSQDCNTPNKNYRCRQGDQRCCEQKTKTQKSLNERAHNKPKCPDGFQGITKHPTDCKKFLNCANGITYVQDCGPGTLFNPIILTCDFPYNVDCKDGDVTTTPSYEDTTQYYSNYDHTVTNNFNPNCQGYGCRNQQNYANIGGSNACQGTHCQSGLAGNVQGQGQYYPAYSEFGVSGSTGTGTSDHLSNGFSSQSQHTKSTNCQGIQCQSNFGTQGHIFNGNLGNIGNSGYSSQGSINSGNQNCQGTGCSSNHGNRNYAISNQGSQGNQDQITPCQGHLCDTNKSQDINQNRRNYVQNKGSINTPDKNACQGYQCITNQGQNINQRPNVNQNKNIDDHSRRNPEQAPAGVQTGINGYRRDNENSHIMKISSKNSGYQLVTPVNKLDRVTYGGFNNEKSPDYVDIFSPDETRNFVYATSTQKSTNKPEKAAWAPSFDDLFSTDVNADYVFEYEDGEPVTLAPENVKIDKKIKSRCEDNDFVCDKRTCISKNFVCDGERDCSDGKDEKHCQKYLNDFKPYKNSRLDVLEKQRWDNVSHATCALLCADSVQFECKSFNYRRIDRSCFLTNENIGGTGALKNYYPCDYYERKSTSVDCTDMHKCPTGKCLTSDQVCDGYNDCGDGADEKDCRASDFGYEVKLVGGKEKHEGRVEVTVFGITGYICDDQFKTTDANVLCKELGFPLGVAEVKGNSYFAKDIKENNTLYMMDDIECIGNETSLMHCKFAGWGIHNCGDHEIAGVICRIPQEQCQEGYWKCDTRNECVKLPFVCDGLDDCSDNSDEASYHCDAPISFRLVNGSKDSEGRLEVRHNDIWGSVCDDDFNEDAAKIICQNLGYRGSAYVKKDAYFGKSDGPIWLDQVSCFGNETSIEKCAHWDWGEHNCDHSEDVGIVCSNEINQVEERKSREKSVSQSINRNYGSQQSLTPKQCGYRNDNIFLQGGDVHFRVVQGSVAKPGEYPWQASLRINSHGKSAHWCGAVVISSKWVLTAAHCLEGYPKGAYVIVAGEYNIDEDEGTEQQVYIEEYYLHDNFREGHKMGNDIAMIKLKGNGFNLNQDIQPICLPDEDSDYERELNCTISGFGTIQTGKSAYSHKLRAAWIPIQKFDVCKMAHIYGSAITEGMICAGDLTGGIDACDGDSGGPLACLENGVFTLYGLTSWGQRCGYANKPGVYVKVSYYKKWIDKIMELHS